MICVISVQNGNLKHLIWLLLMEIETESLHDFLENNLFGNIFNIQYIMSCNICGGNIMKKRYVCIRPHNGSEYFMRLWNNFFTNYNSLMVYWPPCIILTCNLSNIRSQMSSHKFNVNCEMSFASNVTSQMSCVKCQLPNIIYQRSHVTCQMYSILCQLLSSIWHQASWLN